MAGIKDFEGFSSRAVSGSLLLMLLAALLRWGRLFCFRFVVTKEAPQSFDANGSRYMRLAGIPTRVDL